MTGLMLRRFRVPPLVEREMRMAARRWTTYWGRVTLLLFALAPVVVAYVAGAVGVTGPGLGPQLLQIQAGLLFFWVVASAIQLTSDAISFEKREGTLGLLFLTSLTPFDIVAGKLAAASMRTWHGVLAVIPVLGLPMLLGGVTMGDGLRLAAVLANALFVSLAGTLLLSTFCRRDYAAVGWAVLLLGLLFGGIPFLQKNGVHHPILDGLNLANPVMAVWSFPEAQHQINPARFWKQIGAAHLLGWLLIGANVLALPRVWQDRPTGGLRGNWRMSWRQWLLGTTERRQRFRSAALARNPMYWYASREQRTRWMPWIVLFLAVMGVGGMRLIWPELDFNLPAVMFLGWCMQLVYKHWVASAASRTFARGGAEGAVEMVLATALTHREMVMGPLLALRRRFLGPVVAVLILQPVLAWRLIDPDDWELRVPWTTLFVLQLAVFPLDMVAVAVVGLWKGVVSKNASQAMSGTNWWVLLMPWLMTLVIMILALTGNGRFGPDDVFILMFFLSVVMDIVLMTWAWQKLEGGLRAAIFDRFSGGEPWLAGWRWLGRTVAELFSSKGSSTKSAQSH